MTSGGSYQRELRDYLADFHSEHGLPKKAVTLKIPEQKLIAQYETKEGLPNVEAMRRAAKEVGIATGTGAAVAGGVALIIGRTFLGGALGRLGIAGAFGAIGLTAFAPAVLVGGTIAGVGYTVYQLGKNREQNKQAQEFGAKLLAYLRRF